MRAEELMIGDWFQTTFPNGKVEYRKVNAIYDRYVDSKDGVTNNIEPISLTEEILEKNGWEKVGDNSYCLYFSNDIALWFRTDEMEIVLIGGSTISIKYVHQLQHAFKLCGIEKEIVL